MANGLPAGTTDCHAHVFDPMRFPYVPNRAYTPPAAPAAAWRALHEAVGIERGVIVQPSVYGTDNSCTLATLAELGPAYRAVAVIDPAIPDTELAAMERAGVRSVRFNLLQGGAALDDLEPVAKRCAKLGWHVQVLLDPDDVETLAPRLEALPVPVVIDHFGRFPASDLPDATRLRAFLRRLETGRFHVKLSAAYFVSAGAPPFPDSAPLAHAFTAARPDRMLWGTDWPYPMAGERRPRPEDERALIESWFPDEATRRRVLVDNPAALYGFARPD
jgi:2-pyrone-4,6-dicarboxylate lactonase